MCIIIYYKKNLRNSGKLASSSSCLQLGFGLHVRRKYNNEKKKSVLKESDHNK